jgi:dethiobiotin synthetase
VLFDMRPIFITGIGTGIGKTVISSIITKALDADYWKPVQAGYSDGTDSKMVRQLVNNQTLIIHQESYTLKLAASPHIAAREEGNRIELDKIREDFLKIQRDRGGSAEGTLPFQVKNLPNLFPGMQQINPAEGFLVIEGAGGLLSPLNEQEFVIDLIKKLQARVILVSRNYLGSINHSLLTALACRYKGLDVVGWIFNDQYLEYEEEIAGWSKFPRIASVPYSKEIDNDFIGRQARVIRPLLLNLL